MERNRVLTVGLFLVLVALDYSLADTKVKISANSDSDSNLNSKSRSNETVESSLVLNSTQVEVNENEGTQLGGLKKGIEKDTNKTELDNQLGSQAAENVQEGKGDSSEKSKLDESDVKNGKPDDALDPKEVTKEKSNEADSTILTPIRKDNARGEECDPSNMCTDEQDEFVACLRVPGNESPHLSLLIQNKGKGPLTVTISAAHFVHLEQTKVQLREKEDKKVKVSIRSGGANNLIVLTAGNGRCSLDFKDLIAHSSGKDFNPSPNSSYVNILSRSPIISFTIFAAIVILVSGGIYISFHRRQLSSNGSKYQRLDMDLPVSAEPKTDSDTNDGWDNSWGDSWDDEEAPKTPSMPVTPSLSSKGLASRRLSKEAWKD